MKLIKSTLIYNRYHNNTYQIDEDRQVVLDDGPDLKSAQTRKKAKLPYRVKNWDSQMIQMLC